MVWEVLSSGWKAENEFILNKGEDRRKSLKKYKGEERKEMNIKKNFTPRREKELIVAIPSSILYVEPSLREKTLKIAYIIRCLSIFRVDKLVLYYDRTIEWSEHERLVKLFEKIYQCYMIPPYLRKKLIPLDPDLKFMGLVPPLRLNIFDVSKEPSLNEYRLAYVLDRNEDYVIVDAGLDENIKVFCREECPQENEIILIKITSINPPLGQYSKSFEKIVYKGPRYTRLDNLVELTTKYKDTLYIIATSKYGETVSLNMLSKLAKSFMRKNGVLLLFGGPRYGLFDIAKSYYSVDLYELVDIVLNVIPMQGTKTVRTEEALYAALSLLNLVLK